MKKVFPIILEKGNIFNQLVKAKRDFLESDYSVAAIDISNASIPNSTQLGEITVIIRTSTSRDGSTFIYTDNQDALDLLDQVHFSSIATIIKNKDKFDEILKGEVKTTEIPKVKKIIPPKNAPKSKNSSNPKVHSKNDIPLYNTLVTLFLILNLIFTICFAFYTNVKFKSARNIINTLIKTNKEMDEKIGKLSTKIKELELLNEISE